MSSDDIVYNTVSDLAHIPGARMTWGPRSCEPEFPFFVYRCTDRGEFFADGAIRATMPKYEVTLYTSEADPDLEDRVADAVATMGPYICIWEYDPEREAFTTTFSFTLCNRGDES